MINPLLLAGIYWLVFGVIFPGERGGGDYLAYLLSGIFAFYYTRSAMVNGVGSILGNRKPLANSNFPRLVLPTLLQFIQSAIGFGFSLPRVLSDCGARGRHLADSADCLADPIFALHTLFNFGLAAITARMAVPFRDINNLVPYFLRLWLYLSPIIWTVDRLDTVSEDLINLLRLNPMFPILSIYRTAPAGRAAGRRRPCGVCRMGCGRLRAGCHVVRALRGQDGEVPVSEPAIVAKNLTVTFKPNVDRVPTLRRSLACVRQTQGGRTGGGPRRCQPRDQEGGGVRHHRPQRRGKSTLLRVFAKTLRPNSGTINVYGLDIDVAAARCRLQS